MSKETTIDLALVAVILLIVYYVLDSLFGSGTPFAFLHNVATGTLSDAQKQAAIATETASLVQAGMSPEAAAAQATGDVNKTAASSPGCGTWLQCDYDLVKAALTTNPTAPLL